MKQNLTSVDSFGFFFASLLATHVHLSPHTGLECPAVASQDNMVEQSLLQVRVQQGAPPSPSPQLNWLEHHPDAPKLWVRASG